MSDDENRAALLERGLSLPRNEPIMANSELA
jgi:hypothetical protein